MQLSLEPGKYIAAISGGVDSVALLHMLQKAPEVELVVAHFDHGIRTDSGEDRLFVQELAAEYGLPFVYEEGRLGEHASEATARIARYAFLEKVRKQQDARAIITAHHQDDVLETAIINMLRGTGRKGLSALGNQSGLERPLQHVTKKDILSYARQHRLRWREDVTNQDQTYLRNYVRHQLLSRFDEQSKARLLSLIQQAKATNKELDTLLQNQLQLRSNDGRLSRAWFIQLPHREALEVMAAWLRLQGITNFDRKLLERAVIAAKTARSGKTTPLLGKQALLVDKTHLALTTLER